MAAHGRRRLAAGDVVALAVFSVHLTAYVLVSGYALLSILQPTPDANIGLAFALAGYDGLGLPWSSALGPYRQDLGSVVAASLNLVGHLLLCAGVLWWRCRASATVVSA